MKYCHLSIKMTHLEIVVTRTSNLFIQDYISDSYLPIFHTSPNQSKGCQNSLTCLDTLFGSFYWFPKAEIKLLCVLWNKSTLKLWHCIQVSSHFWFQLSYIFPSPSYASMWNVNLPEENIWTKWCHSFNPKVMIPSSCDYSKDKETILYSFRSILYFPKALKEGYVPIIIWFKWTCHIVINPLLLLSSSVQCSFVLTLLA